MKGDQNRGSASIWQLGVKWSLEDVRLSRNLSASSATAQTVLLDQEALSKQFWCERAEMLTAGVGTYFGS